MINSLPFFLWVKSGNISRKFLTFILKIFDKNFERLHYGFEGICLAENVERLAGMDVSLETPSLSQISVAVMKVNTSLGKRGKGWSVE